MKTVGVYEAKTHLARLLAEVELGETVTITRHGKAIARIEPVEKSGKDRNKAIDDLLEFGRLHRGALRGISIRELIEDGRRY